MNEAPSGYARLDDQIEWFDRRSTQHQRWYRRLKVVAIGAAALVPLVSGLDGFAILVGSLGVIVVVVEGLLHINQHYEHWVRYRATCENLRHEKFLYLARSARYEGLDDDDAFRRLAANVELLLSREGEEWVTTLRSLDDKKPETPQPASG